MQPLKLGERRTRATSRRPVRISLLAAIVFQLTIPSLIPSIESFWLTDGTLFGRQLQSAPVSINRLGEPGSLVEGLQVVAGNAGHAIERGPVAVAAGQAEEAQRTVASNLTQAVASPNKQVNTATNQEVRVQSQVTCECSADWFQAQAGQWLARWLQTDEFKQFIVRTASGSNWMTAASRPKPLAWNKTPKPTSSTMAPGSRRSRSGVPAAQAKLKRPAQDNHDDLRASLSNKWLPRQRPPPLLRMRPPPLERELAADQLTQSVSVNRDEQGPKGERGPAGERGPSGLLTVRDRDALFDLASARENSSQPQSGPKSGAPERRLVFVESDQLLVMETSLGWRPLQMQAAPLRDFRKAIAKFSLSSANDRRRLLQSAALGRSLHQANLVGEITDGGNSLRVANGETRADTDGRDDEVETMNEERSENDDDNGDENDDDNVEENDDDNDNDDDDDDVDEDDDDDNDDDGDEDEDANENANRINSAVMIPELVDKPKRRLAQVADRSALAPRWPRLPVRSETKGADSMGGPSIMKLRLAALNEPYAGNLHGLRGANFECRRSAARYNARGAFKALLATNYQSLNEIVRYSAHVHKFPIVNLRGESLASSWHELFRAPARMVNPLSRVLSFDGRHVASDPKWPNKLVWHGAANKWGQRDSAHNCDGWHSDSMAKYGLATPIHSLRARQQAAGRAIDQNGKRVQGQQRRSAEQLNDQPPALTNLSALADAMPASSSKWPPVFDVIEKFPCRMPLIVLCIETVAQSD